MDIKGLFGEKKPDQEFFWALVLEPGWVQAAVWTISGEKAEVVSFSSSTAWKTDEDLINASDTALSSAIQNLPEEIGEPTKTVFGVPNFWVEKGQIKEEYLEKIKKICSNLSLEPTGFVVLSEAIAHLSKSQEGTPLNAIVVGVREENIEVTLFKLGNLAGSANISRSVSVADDVVEGLARFDLKEPYPSRILVYDGKGGELEDIRQVLLSTDWEKEKKVRFLHTPKIEIIDPEKKVTATSLAGASEISNITKVETAGKEEEKKEGIPSDVENIEIPEKPVAAQDLGFVVDEDIADKTLEEKVEAAKKEVSYFPEPLKEKLPISGIKKLNLLGFIKSFFTKFKFPKIPKIDARKNLVLGGIIFSVLMVSGFTLWWFLPKASVVIFVAPKSLEDKFSLNIDTSLSSSDFSKGVLSGKSVSSEVAGEKTKSATGKKTVGEKARGNVKIQNGTSSVINLPAGIVLTSSNDLKFTTDNSASVSAAISPSLPGEADVDITASDIGAGSNLAKDEVFKVANYPKPEVDAISTANFSGGTSREISAVSVEDQKTLEEDLTQELFEKAKNELKGKVKEDEFLVEESLLSDISSKSFSSKVGDESINLKLVINLKALGVTIRKTEIFEYAKKVLEGKIPTGYILRTDQIKFRFNLKESKDKIFVFDVSLSVNLLPQIDTKNIQEKIKGRDSKVVEKYLEGIPGFKGAEIKFNPKLPGFLGTLPRVAKNTTVELSTQR